jgi:glycerate dehydrogenase
MKIVVLDSYTVNPGDLNWSELEKLGELVLYDRTSADQTISRSKEADAILTNKVVVDSTVIASLSKLRYIGVLATGTNVVDLNSARTRGIVVTNVPRYCVESVVQSVFAHLLNLVSNFSKHVAAVQCGEWVNSPDFSFSKGKPVELYGKRLGIVGFGATGRRVAQVAAAFGMKVVAYSPRLSLGSYYDEVQAVSLDDLFRISDVVSLHCPLTEQTRNLVNKQRLEAVKNGMLLINVSRGSILNEQDVADALNSGRLGGLGADVLSTEPPATDNPLLYAPNCYLTPHNAWATYEARTRLIQIATNNLKAFLENKPVNVVN